MFVTYGLQKAIKDYFLALTPYAMGKQEIHAKLYEKSHGNGPLEILTTMIEDNINYDLQETGCEDENWLNIGFTGGFVMMVMKVLVT
jgi:hypothetical protein